MSLGCGNRNVKVVTMVECLSNVSVAATVGMRLMLGRMWRFVRRVVLDLRVLCRSIWVAVVRGVECLPVMSQHRLMMMVCR